MACFADSLCDNHHHNYDQHHHEYLPISIFHQSKEFVGLHVCISVECVTISHSLGQPLRVLPLNGVDMIIFDVGSSL